MGKKVVLVGHCGPDSAYLKMTVRGAGKEIEVLSADSQEDLDAVLEKTPDLLLLNRELGYGFADGMGVDMIGRLKKSHPEIKTMLVSNYPEAQAAATAAGGVPGFGKRELGTPRVAELLRNTLGA